MCINGERQPLQPGNGSSNDQGGGLFGKCSKSNLVMGTILAGVLILYIGFPTDNSVDVTHLTNSKEEGPTLPEVEDPAGDGATSSSTTSNTVMYRPFCVHYGDEKEKGSVKLLQTSMQNPSQQWSSLPCYHESQRKSLWSKLTAGDGDDHDYNNKFGSPDASLEVNLSQPAFPQRQTPILGFGGAFTEASSLNFHSLDTEGQEAVLELLFGKTGLGYTKGRVPMNSCDFSIESYNFDDTDGDFTLKDFDTDVQHDVDSGMIDFALRATEKVRSSWTSAEKDDGMDGTLRLYASPWSPPAWMKSASRKEANHGATHAKTMLGSTQPTCLKEGTKPESPYARAWALYFSKFLTAYEHLGLPFFGVTPQNEPEFPAPWEACSHTPVTESEFIGYHLGPQLREDHPNVKIVGFDHNKDHIVTWVNGLIGDTSPSTPYVSGTAYHWYAGGNNRILDGALGAPNMHLLQQQLDQLEADPEHFIINIESCHCPYTGYAGGSIDAYWARAERYAHTIMSDLAAGSNGWLEWNFILDSQGGPNHLGNLCDSSLLAAPHRAKNASKDIPNLFDWETTNATARFGANVGDGRTLPELNALGFPAKYLEVGVVVQPMYYYMGHISRYVRPGSRAVMALANGAESEDGSLTFRPKGKTVPGGGINGLAQPDVELTVWPCEGSTRQSFQWDASSQQLQVHGHDWVGTPTTSCFSNEVHKDLGGLVLVQCDTQHNAATFDIVENGDNVNFRLKNGPHKGQCLIIKELGNKGGAYGPLGGAQVAIGPCKSDISEFVYDEATSEISSTFFAEEDGNDNRVCITTGWPFLQMGAFDTPNGESKKTVLILNEAQDAANYVVRDNGKVLVTGSIPPRSIQTLLIG